MSKKKPVIMDLATLIKFGKDLGYEGVELQKFVKETQEADREERQHVRDAQREKEARESSERIAIAKIHSEEQDKIRAHEARMKDLELRTPAAPAPVTPTPKKGYKMTSFNEEKDSMDSYLLRFERFAEAQKWKPEEYAIYLAAQLQGNSLEVYTRLAPGDSNNYNVLKAALLKHYSLTEEGFRKKFYTSHMEKTETATQYMARLANYFDRWIDLAVVDKTYDKLRQFMIVEKFLHMIPKDVSIFIREHEEHGMNEVTKLADRYIDAHQLNKVSNDRSKDKLKPKTNGDSDKHIVKQDKVKEEPADKPSTSKVTVEKRKVTCFLCNKEGHKAPDCPVKKKLIAACLEVDDENLSDTESYKSECLATCIVISDEITCQAHNDDEILNRMPVIGSSCLLPEDKLAFHNLPLEKGTVNGKVVSVLRDTGCTSVIVKKDLVTSKQFTGQKRAYISVDKTVRSVPIAEIYIDTPFYTGTVKALCLEDPVCDLIIGNVKSVVNQENDILHKHSYKTKDSTLKQSHSMIGNTSVKPKPSTPNKPHSDESQKAEKTIDQKKLQIHQLPHVEDAEKFCEDQQTDESLNDLRNQERDKKTTVRSTLKYQIVKQDNLYYRKIIDKENDLEVQEKQLLIPKNYRNRVLEMGHDSILGGHFSVGKTLKRIQSQFYWPEIDKDIKMYCKSCLTCKSRKVESKVNKFLQTEGKCLETET